MWRSRSTPGAPTRTAARAAARAIRGNGTIAPGPASSTSGSPSGRRIWRRSRPSTRRTRRPRRRAPGRFSRRTASATCGTRTATMSWARAGCSSPPTSNRCGSATTSRPRSCCARRDGWMSPRPGRSHRWPTKRRISSVSSTSGSRTARPGTTPPSPRSRSGSKMRSWPSGPSKDGPGWWRTWPVRSRAGSGSSHCGGCSPEPAGRATPAWIWWRTRRWPSGCTPRSVPPR